jgi:hypothetical protein
MARSGAATKKRFHAGWGFLVELLEDHRGPGNKQLQRTVIRQRVRAAGAPFHLAPAPRWARARAAAELRRYATVETWIVA